MISQEYLNSEIDLAKRIYLYYWGKMADYISVGSDKYIKWYKDLCNLLFLTKSLLNLRIVDDTLYLGSQETDVDFFALTISKVREYLTYETKQVVYSDLDAGGNLKDAIIPSIPPTVVTYSQFFEDWRQITLTATEDGQSEFILPFTYDQIDPEATRVITSLDTDPLPFKIAPEEGYNISGNILYIHTYYELKAGDQVSVQYLLIVDSAVSTATNPLYIQTATATSSNYTSISSWTTTTVNGTGDYTIATQTYSGYAYLYLTYPVAKTFKVYDELGSNITDQFTLVGTTTVDVGVVNNVYKINSQIDTTISLNLTVPIS